jgi:hypothetical protein
LATPTITLTAALQDFCGNNAGTVANPAKLRIALCGYYNELPRIAGTSNLAQVGPSYYYDSGSGIEIELWGNDVITPGPTQTYYDIAVIDGEGNMVQCAAYQFVGTQTIDLSNATPITPPGPPVPVPPGNTFAWSEVPAGTIDGTNATFTLEQAPNPAGSLQFFKNGSRLTLGVGYSLTGNTITYTTDYIPQPGDTHIAGSYVYLSGTPTTGSTAWSEVPSGTIDGTNDVFTLANAPNPPGSLQFFKNGLRMTEGIGFTLLGTEITYEADYIPQPGDSHIAGSYLY